MRILILNWRCPLHPKAGGAEMLTHEIARRLVASGHSLEWFSASFPGSPASESLDGVQIVRAGRQSTVHLNAFRHYRGKLRGRFDLVIDEINTIPFFTPLWSGIPRLALIFQLARNVWWYEMGFPLNALGFALEPLYLAPYHHTPIVTISESTRKDLRRMGFKGSIRVMPIAIEELHVSQVKKASVPTFLYVGRLAPSKRVHDIIRAFSVFHEQAGAARLSLIGTGDSQYVAGLKRQTESLRVAEQVEFLGWLPPPEKHRHMAQATALLMASVREGWGLVITEANALGTPAIVYDVPGLRDAVHDGETGLVVGPSPAEMANGMFRLALSRDLYDHLTAGAKAWSETFSFDRTFLSFNEEISSWSAQSERSMETAR
jgi:glycosyltransferase involved in cell wall biosynthesis